MGVVLDEQRIEAILAEAERVLAPYVVPDGQVAFDAPADVVTGMRA